MPNQPDDVERLRVGPGGEVRGECLAQHVDVALSPLLQHLTPTQAELVRSTVQASIDFDPVSRQLVENAKRVSDRSNR